MATKAEIEQRKKIDRGIAVTSHEMKPTNKDNIHLSKAQYIEQERVRKENNLKVKEFAENLQKETVAKKEDKKETKRPKKIE